MSANQTTSTAANTSNYQEVKDALLRAGVSSGVAQTLALNELRYFHGAELEELASNIKRPSPTHFPLRRDNAAVEEWVRPSLELMEKSAKEEKVLCVDKHGEFSLRDGDDEPYMALSHSWSEGLCADAEGRGLALWQIQDVFHRAESSGVEWLWVDALAVPNWRDLSPREKELNRLLVNRMYDIYANAAGVVVLDALLLHMHSTHPADVAIGALMGQWMTRVWTYQELKMASEAFFVTATGTCKYTEIVKYLNTLKGLFAAGMGASSEHQDKYNELQTTWRRLQRVSGRPCIAYIALASQNREATVPIDQSIGFCGVLRILLDPRDDTLDQVTAKIYYSQPMWAKRMPFMHGPRLQISPRWAPAKLCGLSGGGDWDDREQQAQWDNKGLHLTCFMARVRCVVSSEIVMRETWGFNTSKYQAYSANIVFEAKGGREGRCTVFFCKEDSAGDAHAQVWRDMLLRSSWEGGGNPWLLMRRSLPKHMSPGDVAQQALLALRHPGEARSPEYDILGSVEIVGCWGHVEMEQQRVTLCN